MQNYLHRIFLLPYSQLKYTEMIKYLQGNLFDATSSLCHCVSRDMRMGKGIALEFKNIFGNVEYLKSQNIGVGGIAVLNTGNRFIYYLVTKEKYNDKPTYESLYSSLYYMCRHMIENKVTSLSMPMIGCGLDKLEWNKVEYLIQSIFSGTGIQITCYSL